MRRTVRTVTLVLFLAIVLACGLAIFYFGTLTGLTFGGQQTVTGSSSTKAPFYAQVGWLRNTSPWPVTITSITTNAVNTNKPATVYIQRDHVDGAVKAGATPDWVKVPEPIPYELVGGSLRYLGFAMTPQRGQVAAMTSITVNFSGPLGFSFHKTFSGARIAAQDKALPVGILGRSPAANPTSLDGYIVPLRAALDNRDTAALAAVMGNGATKADAAVFLKEQSAYVAADKLSVALVSGQPNQRRILFYLTDTAKDALPAITLSWAHYRWSILLG